MKTFGWKHPDLEEVPVPVNKKCVGCDAPINKISQGVVMPFLDAGVEETECAWHRGCLLRTLGFKEELQRQRKEDKSTCSQCGHAAHGFRECGYEPDNGNYKCICPNKARS